MKVSYWIFAIIVTFAIAYSIGYATGQRLTLESDVVVDSNITSIPEAPSEALSSALGAQNKTDAKPSPTSTQSSSDTVDDMLTEIANLLDTLEENPNHRSSAIKLYSILETLSADQLIALAPSLESKSEAQRKMLSETIIALLIEKAPGKALAFAQQHSSMSDSPYYMSIIKAGIAEKIPELGFEYLNQILLLTNEDTDLSENTALILALADADLKQLVRTLAEFEDVGVKLENSLSGIAYGLETNEEHLALFNELRQLNDISVLQSVLINWVRVSPGAVFERLNAIEDTAERKGLSDSAFHYWMLDSPEVAADHHLANASNKLKMIKEILQIWPDEKASDALNWLSAQRDIDINRYKIDYLKELSYSEPKFVQSHLNDINLNDDEKLDFYHTLYNGFKLKSSDDAEQFLNTLPLKDEILSKATENGNTDDNRNAKIAKAFKRYFDFKYDKAFALATGENGAYAYSFVVNKSSQQEANQLALRRCEQRRHKYNVANKCKIYAEGDVTMFNLTP